MHDLGPFISVMIFFTPNELLGLDSKLSHYWVLILIDTVVLASIFLWNMIVNKQRLVLLWHIRCIFCWWSSADASVCFGTIALWTCLILSSISHNHISYCFRYLIDLQIATLKGKKKEKKLAFTDNKLWVCWITFI